MVNAKLSHFVMNEHFECTLKLYFTIVVNASTYFNRILGSVLNQDGFMVRISASATNWGYFSHMQQKKIELNDFVFQKVFHLNAYNLTLLMQSDAIFLVSSFLKRTSIVLASMLLKNVKFQHQRHWNWQNKTNQTMKITFRILIRVAINGHTHVPFEMNSF